MNHENHKNIRNFCIIAHIDAGKSTLADRLLELTGTIQKQKMKDQYLDQMDLERERGITIKLQPVRMVWRPARIKTDKQQIITDKKIKKGGLLYEELTYKVRRAIFNVYNELGPGFKENIYQKSLKEEFKKCHIPFQTEKNIDIFYHNKKVGNYKPDFIIDNKIIVELKAIPFIGKLEKKQVWHYLKGTKYKLALLVNFGQTKLQIERIIYNPNFHSTVVTNNIRLIPSKNPFLSEYILNLIDTPGHVDFSYEVSRSLAAVEGAILLVDATRGIQAQTLANLYQAINQDLDIIPVINKIDLPSAQICETKKEIKKILNINEDEILEISAKTGQNVKAIFPEIIAKIKPPKIELKKPLRGLIFDSQYDNYRGVVAHIRIVDGMVEAGQKINFMATGTVDEVLEVGFFSPGYTKKDKLSSGEIGYIVTGLKNISQCKVGDTITTTRIKTDKTITRIISDEQSNNSGFNIRYYPRKNPLQSVVVPLQGYKQVKPVVFAQIYSKDGEVDKLRDGLEKLSLNDSSLSFKPTNSQVFGMGFECGFLGLLHLDIVKERLIREYNLDLIITSPRVDYKIKSESSKKVYYEPWVRLEVITPQAYIGPIIDLTIGIRGKYKSTEYISNRVMLNFETPLANIITNYYNHLKSISSGYASLNYEFYKYRKEDLVQMDILIAGDKYENLSQIVHQNELISRAKNTVKKLKELLPKQSFKVTIQAACGGKIIARENLGALKKDVIGHLYGGDVSRKKKLLKKQAKGKKRMQRFGKVDIPTDVFIKLIK